MAAHLFSIEDGSTKQFVHLSLHSKVIFISLANETNNNIAGVFWIAPKPVGRRHRRPGTDRKPRQAYSVKQLEQLESEFKVRFK